jgi:predicted ATPase/DNA-binding XRE family transcriptional regulator
MGGQRQAVPAPLGDRLRALRQAAGLTQEELAERAGLTAHAVSALERGTRTRPHPHTLRSLASALQISDRDLALLRAAASAPGSGTAQDAADPAAAVRQRTPLPHAPTPLIGRARELATIARILRDREGRLVTLTGAGGVGKTRLAVAVAEALVDGFPDGVSYVPLAALSDPALVLPTVGRALGLAGLDPVEASAAVAEHLRPRRHLLLLDNVEHLTAAAPELAELAAECPELTILVTSRASLRVRGEVEFPIQPLALPDERDPGVAAVLTSPAGALFAARARAVAAGFAVTEDNVAAVAAICRRLAGIPLALELAAARLRYLPPDVLLDRLGDAMAREGARDLPARQRTMRAAIDWSYRLLSPAEQRLFRRLSVFAGGFTLDAAEHVGAAGQDAPDVLGLLESLVEQSLVVVPSTDGHPRYAMLEPIAQYARELLDQAGEATRVHAAHAAFHLDLVERAEPQYQREEQLQWLARMDPETANTTRAVEWALAAGKPATAARFCRALAMFWWLRGHLHLGRRLAEATLTHRIDDHVLHTRTLLTAGTMAFGLGDLDGARRHCRHALRIARARGNTAGQANALSALGAADLSAGHLDAAEDALTAALELVESPSMDAEDEWTAALTNVWLGTVRMLRGDLAGAREHMARGLGSARSRGDRLISYIALYNLSQVALAEDDHERARTHLREGIELSWRTRDAANLAYLFESLAVVDGIECRPQRVATLLGAAESMREIVGADVYGYYLPDRDKAAQAAARARAALGADVYDDRLDAGRALDLDDAVAYALRSDASPLVV